MENYYERFGIPRDADEGEIRKRIHQELRKWSNRTNAPQMERRQEAERMVQLLEEAEEILLDPDKRAAYDRQLAAASRLQTSARREQASTASRTGTGTVTPVETIISRGTELLEQNRVADTIVLARQATEQDPHNPDAWALLAHAKKEWGEPEQAVEAFRRAIELKPNDGRYYYGLGQTLEQLNRWEEAVTQYRRASKTDPDNHQYRVALGMALIRTEQFDEGLALLEQCVQAESDNPAYQESLALGYQAKAYYSWTEVPAGHPMMAEGRYPTTYQQYRTALRYLSKALALRFDNPQLRQSLRETLKKVEKEGTRLFTGSKLSIGIVWALAIYSLFVDATVGARVFLFLLPAFYIASALTPKYKMYQSLIRHGTPHSDLALADEWLSKRIRRIGSVIVFVILGIYFMPWVMLAVTLYNFYHNYPVKRWLDVVFSRWKRKTMSKKREL